MPKKKLSPAALEREKVPPVASNGSLDVMKTADKPDEETLKKMKEKLLNEYPEFKHMFQFMEKMSERRTEQAQDSYAVLANERGKTLLRHYS